MVGVTPDQINGLFEFSGGSFQIINILALGRDQDVKGVHWLPSLYFLTWSAWNLYYYPALGQWFSFFGGIFLMAVNLTWLFMVWRVTKPRDSLADKR